MKGKISILILLLFNINFLIPKLSSPAYAKDLLLKDFKKTDNTCSVFFLAKIVEKSQPEEKPEKGETSSKLHISPTSEDFCHSFNINIRSPFRFHFIYLFVPLEEKMNAHPCFNVISPPPDK